MKLSHLFIFHTIVFFAFAFVLLVSPKTLFDFYEIEYTAAGVYLGRLIACCYAAIGICAWFMRDEGPSRARFGFLLSLLFFNFSVALIMGEATIRKVTNGMGYGGLTLGVVLGLGCLYFLVMRRTV